VARHVTKPILGITSIGGNKFNNVLFMLWGSDQAATSQQPVAGPLPARDSGLKGNDFTVFMDPNQATGSPQRYRGLTGNLALTSPDGFNWTVVASVCNIP
jgi:hypothetical protein